ncbi:MAG: putative mannose-6-phosphate isomerase [Bryobacterales bacterium]|jgi:mannose-6-phosphate isomerase|nr:putative mannose-6-phosphate isomerase [Bryobacterales bacterium]
MLTRLTPRFLPKVWGSTHLEPWYRDAREKIGEVWFEDVSNLPLLIKFLFTTEPLSVQVHPEGKTEMWHILAADPGAKIAAGFREPITEQRLRASALSGEIEQLLEWFEARPGDTFFIPAGTVHAIGAGLALCEIQQHSDITYRLFDYGRPRELHLDQGVRVSRLGPHAARQSAREGVLVSCPYFITERIRLDGGHRCEAVKSGQTVILLEGEAEVGPAVLRAGEAWHTSLPESLDLRGRATLLRTYTP